MLNLHTIEWSLRTSDIKGAFRLSIVSQTSRKQDANGLSLQSVVSAGSFIPGSKEVDGLEMCQSSSWVCGVQKRFPRTLFIHYEHSVRNLTVSSEKPTVVGKPCPLFVVHMAHDHLVQPTLTFWPVIKSLCPHFTPGWLQCLLREERGGNGSSRRQTPLRFAVIFWLWFQNPDEFNMNLQLGLHCCCMGEILVWFIAIGSRKASSTSSPPPAY